MISSTAMIKATYRNRTSCVVHINLYKKQQEGDALDKTAEELKTVEELRVEELRNENICIVDPNILVDIRDVIIDMELPRAERIVNFLRQIKNPILCKYGDVMIESVFSNENVTLTEKMEQCLRMS